MTHRTQQPVPLTSTPIVDARGIESLKIVDSLSINHGFSFKQTPTDVGQRVKYGIFDDQGRQLFSVFEESNWLQSVTVVNNRAFVIHVLDNQNQEVIRVHRESQPCSGCCWCGSCESCMHRATVESPPGHIIGTVQQEGSAGGRNYVIRDANDRSILMVMGPCCICNGNYACGCENRFVLLGTDRATEIGAIEKKYLSSLRTATAHPVAFTVNFPMNLDVRAKASVLGALFLIDIALYKFVHLLG